MKILLKHTLRSLSSNKGQAFVMILTIVLVTTMIFASFSMFDMFYSIQMAEYDRIADGADMLVGSHIDSEDLYSKARLDSLLDKNDIADIKYFTKFTSILKTEDDTKTVLVEATNLQDYLSANPIRFLASYEPESVNIFNFSYGDTNAGIPLIIINQNFAKKANLKAGDLVEIYIPTFANYAKMKVGFVAANEGIFSSPASKNILLDFSAIENMGQLSATYIKFKDPKLYNKYKPILEKEFPAVEIKEGNSYSYVMSIVQNNTTLLTIALLLLIGVMVLILYSTYIIIAAHRMKELVIFKAVGATPKQSFAILLLEVLVYATIGITVGLVLGRFLFTLGLKLMLPQALNAIKFPVWKYLLTAVLSLIVTLLSVAKHLHTISKKSMLEMKSEDIKVAKNTSVKILVPAFLVLLALVIAYFFTRGIARMAIAFISIPLVVFCVYAASGWVFKFFAKLFRNSKLGASTYASTRSGALKQLTVMLSLVITFAFLVVQLVSLVKIAITPFNSRFHSDYVIEMQKLGTDGNYYKFNDEIIKTVDGVRESTFFNEVSFSYPGHEDDSEQVFTVFGVSDYKHIGISTKNVDKNTEKRWGKSDYPLIISNDVALRLNLKIGDVLKVHPFSQDYKQRTFHYDIVGIDYTLSQWDQVAYTKYDLIAGLSQPVKYMILADNNNQVFIDLRQAVEDSGISQTFVLKFDEWAYVDADTFAGIGSILTFVQVYVYIVAIIGILNMAIMSFYNRRNEMVIYKVSGMSNSDFMKFNFGEVLLIILTGGVIGVIGSFIVNLSVPIFNIIVNQYVGLTIFPFEILVVFIISISLFLTVWMLIANFNKRRNISSLNERLNE